MGDINSQAEVSKESVRDAAIKAAEAKAAEENGKRTGKGLRLKVGSTRGKNPQVITFEAFDLDSPDTLPSDFAEFQTLSGVADEKEIVELLIIGHNAKAYSLASDPIAEYYEPDWTPDMRSGFKASVKGLTATGVINLETAVQLVKGAIAASKK